MHSLVIPAVAPVRSPSAWRPRLALAGCSGKDSTEDANGNGTPDAQETAQGLTVAGEWPLTGLARGASAPAPPGDGRQDRQHREQQPRSSA